MFTVTKAEPRTQKLYYMLNLSDVTQPSSHSDQLIPSEHRYVIYWLLSYRDTLQV